MVTGPGIPIPPHLRGLDRDLTLYDWRAVIRRLRCHPSVKLVALMAADYGNRDGTRIHPGIERLANVTNQDDRTVKLALTWLRKHGLMHRTVEGSRYGRRGGVSDEHVLTIPLDISGLPLLPHDESSPERDAKRDALRAKDARRKQARKAAPGQEQVISDPEQVISDTGTGDLRSRNPVSEITPPSHAPSHVPDHDGHHSEQARPHAAARGRLSPGDQNTFAAYEAAHRKIMVRDGEQLGAEDEEFVSATIGHDFVRSIVGDLDVAEESTVLGMLDKGTHPKAIVNTILKARGESESAYRAASLRMLELPDDVRQRYVDAADDHCAAHFPEATHRYRMIYADRLAQSRVGART